MPRREFVVEKVVDFGEAGNGTRLSRVIWLCYEAIEDTWEPEECLPAILYGGIERLRGELFAIKASRGTLRLDHAS
jgi:hypothetical protein